MIFRYNWQNYAFFASLLPAFNIYPSPGMTHTTLSWLKYHEVLDSTNEKLKSLTPAPPHGTCIMAGHQHAGRGHAGNTWHSEADKNLLLSFYAEPQSLPAASQFLITCIAALSVADIIETDSGKTVSIKWPNDIYLDKRKLAGLLIENTIYGDGVRSSIIGIGLNVNQCVFPDDLPNPVSLFQADGQTRDLTDLAIKLRDRLIDGFRDASPDRFPQLINRYHSKLYQINQEAGYRIGGIETPATIRGIDEFGRLRVEIKGRERVFGFKELEYCL